MRLIDLAPAGGVGGAGPIAVDDLLTCLDAIEGEGEWEPMSFKFGGRQLSQAGNRWW